MEQFYKNQAMGFLFMEVPSDNCDYDKIKDPQWSIFERFSQNGRRDWHTVGFQLCEEYELFDSEEIYSKALELIEIQKNAVEEYIEEEKK